MEINFEFVFSDAVFWGMVLMSYGSFISHILIIPNVVAIIIIVIIVIIYYSDAKRLVSLLQGKGSGASMFVQSLRGDPFQVIFTRLSCSLFHFLFFLSLAHYNWHNLSFAQAIITIKWFTLFESINVCTWELYCTIVTLGWSCMVFTLVYTILSFNLLAYVGL